MPTTGAPERASDVASVSFTSATGVSASPGFRSRPARTRARMVSNHPGVTKPPLAESRSPVSPGREYATPPPDSTKSANPAAEIREFIARRDVTASANLRASARVYPPACFNSSSITRISRAMGGMARFSAPSERVNSAPMNSNPTESATWTTTSALRRRAWAGPAVRPSYRSPEATARRRTSHAGASPVAMVTAAARPRANVATRQSKGIANGKAVPASRSATTAPVAPIADAVTESARLSSVNRRMSWRRVAPSDSRTASSRVRSVARASCRLATFAQAMASTDIGTLRKSRMIAMTSLGASPGPKPWGRVTTRACGRVAGEAASIRRAATFSCASASWRVEPGASRPTPLSHAAVSGGAPGHDEARVSGRNNCSPPAGPSSRSAG